MKPLKGRDLLEAATQQSFCCTAPVPAASFEVARDDLSPPVSEQKPNAWTNAEGVGSFRLKSTVQCTPYMDGSHRRHDLVLAFFRKRVYYRWGVFQLVNLGTVDTAALLSM